MDDLTLVRDLVDDAPLLNQSALAPARARLVAGTTATAPVRLLRHRSRFALLGGTTIGLAAAVAAAITLVPQNQPPVTGTGGLAMTGTSQPAATRPDAVQVLNLAAQRVLATPFAVPRPDQFIYARSEGRESWQSVDGTRDGLIAIQGSSTPIPGCRDGRKQVTKGGEFLPGVTEECVPEPAYRSDLPTTTDAMLEYLDRNASGTPGDVNARGKDILRLVGEALLAPETRAALFQAASRVPGLEVVADVRDATGKAAIGITWPLPPAGPSASAPPGGQGGPKPEVLVFDPTTYEYLGSPTRAAGEVYVVDESGQRP
jgi:hypothetical protein